jgi:hypothetical protein
MDPKNLTFKDICFVLVGFFLCVGLLGVIMIPNEGKKADPPKPLIVTKSPPQPAPPVESRAEYEKTAKRIGEKTDPIYIKAFTKNPDKYAGQRVKVSVKVFKIEEQDSKTLMNVYLSKDYEPAIVYYEGESDIYDGDVIMVYGEVVGRLEGQNALGASMTWPTIHARYFKKLKEE